MSAKPLQSGEGGGTTPTRRRDRLSMIPDESGLELRRFEEGWSTKSWIMRRTRRNG